MSVDGILISGLDAFSGTPSINDYLAIDNGNGTFKISAPNLAKTGNIDVVASIYSTSKTYAVGDYVIYNNNLYRCTTAITTAEAWTSGHWTQVVLADDVCDLKADVMPLQTILIELMSNVYHHAYEKHSFMAKRWYMYAEYVDDYIQCVFVDTGYGIAKTVRKNFREWIKQAIGFKPKDAKLIESAFNGDFRTATNQPFRGNGLNHVKNKVLSGLFDRFEVYSGGGMVGIEKNGDKAKMTTVDYKNTLYGTLFVFTIRKVQNDSN